MENIRLTNIRRELSDCWDFFDKVYCITLDERPDRREEAKIQFYRVGLEDRVEFVYVKKHPTNRERGIYESHIQCLKKGILEKGNRFLIFEDDIVFDRFNISGLENAIHFLSEDTCWDMFFLGCMVKKSKRTKNRSVLKVKYRSLTHAYGVTRKFAEILVENPWQGIPYDYVLSGINDNYYAIYPSFAFQSNSRSDNDQHPYLTRVRLLLGGLKRIQKMNEFYHLNRFSVILIHFMVLLLIVLILA